MKMKYHIIKEIEPDSVISNFKVEIGDSLLSINNQKIKDIFDYRFFILDENLKLVFMNKYNEEYTIEIVKEYEEDLGLIFDSGLMDDYRSCHNKCIFCFIDQMPSGMRDTLYFKDDNTRLSFLQVNYVTLTNLSQ